MEQNRIKLICIGLIGAAFTLVAFLSVTIQPSELPQSTEKATVLLITNEDLRQDWKRFAEWKTSIGKPTKIITIKEIKKSYKGRDIQEKIRKACLSHINNANTNWVILGGDSDEKGGIVPHRTTPHSAYTSRYQLPTDYYYISESDWDANKNNVYGEFGADKNNISYTNDKACIGRIPVRTEQDVQAYTDKIIAYESNYPEQNFADNMVYTCNVSSAYAKLGTSNSILEKSCTNLNFDQIFTDPTKWAKHRKQNKDITSEDWIKLINDGNTAKMHMHGHGLINLWVMNDGKHITANEVDQLTNKNAYPVITTVSCFTGQFDNKQDPCIAESMIRKKDGGAVIVICPSRPGVPVFEDPGKDFELMMSEGKMDATTTTMTKFWEYGQTNNITTGEAFRMVKKEMAPLGKKFDRYHFVLCELNLLGDPSLTLRSTNPTKAKLETTIQNRGNSKDIKVMSSPNATICISGNNGYYQVIGTDESGNVTFSLDNSLKGKFIITASGYNYNVNQVEVQLN